eukprot:COSAG06_NODE_518_length_14769_cov_75.390048_6_plen_105_part_00
MITLTHVVGSLAESMPRPWYHQQVEVLVGLDQRIHHHLPTTYMYVWAYSLLSQKKRLSLNATRMLAMKNGQKRLSLSATHMLAMKKRPETAQFKHNNTQPNFLL